MTASPKYPRTPHLPWSPGRTGDERCVRIDDPLCGVLQDPIVITEKMDGSNVCLEHERVFARSHGGAPPHPSFDVLKARHAEKRHIIPDGIQVFGEWCLARHSIAYASLPDYLLIFGVRDHDVWMPWYVVKAFAHELGFPTVPELAVHLPMATPKIAQQQVLKALTDRLGALPSACGGEREGVVVRLAGGFDDSEFNSCVAKWVRKGHVQTDDHWRSQVVVRNGLARDPASRSSRFRGDR